MRSAGKCRLRALHGKSVSGLAHSTHLPFKNPCNFFFTHSASINERQVNANPSPNSHNGPPEEEQEGCQQHQLQVGACYEVRKGYAQSPEIQRKTNFGLTNFVVTLGYSLPSRVSDLARPSSSSLLATLLLSASLSSSTTACFPRPHPPLLWKQRKSQIAMSLYKYRHVAGNCNMILLGNVGLLDNISLIELGTACGKLFRCSTMAILDAGDSDILSDQQA
ncbi:hypothetical protein Lal_00045072 [Lupinus albus]|nr:hypothetical protein Lal_00045072 [Lupinus albus]